MVGGGDITCSTLIITCGSHHVLITCVGGAGRARPEDGGKGADRVRGLDPSTRIYNLFEREWLSGLTLLFI